MAITNFSPPSAMRPIKSFLPTGFARRPVSSHNQSFNSYALSISLALNFLFILLVGSRFVFVSEKKSKENIFPAAVNIRLIKQTDIEAVSPVNPADLSAPAEPAQESSKEAVNNDEPANKTLAPLDMPVQEQPHYFRTDEVTEKPRPLSIMPTDLPGATVRDDPGSAIFRLRVNELGDIDDVMIEKSSFGESQQLLIVEGLRKMKLEPGKKNGRPVKTEMLIELTVEEINSTISHR
jgi:hypothetical protein